MEPCYQLPTDKYLSETLILKIYYKAYFKVKDNIASTSSVSITTDVCSSVIQDSYISLMCHYIGEDFNQ